MVKGQTEHHDRRSCPSRPSGSAGRPARRANDQVSAGDMVLGTYRVLTRYGDRGRQPHVALRLARPDRSGATSSSSATSSGLRSIPAGTPPPGRTPGCCLVTVLISYRRVGVRGRLARGLSGFFGSRVIGSVVDRHWMKSASIVAVAVRPALCRSRVEVGAPGGRRSSWGGEQPTSEAGCDNPSQLAPAGRAGASAVSRDDRTALVDRSLHRSVTAVIGFDLDQPISAVGHGCYWLRVVSQPALPRLRHPALV